MERRCRTCQAVLNRYHPGDLCYACQDKELQRLEAAEEEIVGDKVIVDLQWYAEILGLESIESVKRLARKGKLAPRVPETREWRWYKNNIDAWIKQRQDAETADRERDGWREQRRMANLLASNLRRLHHDDYFNIIHKIPGDIIFGIEEYNGTTEDLRIDIIKLPEIEKSSANGLIGMLPGREFLELKGIIDWAQVLLDRINEDFLVRLESYF